LTPASLYASMWQPLIRGVPNEARWSSAQRQMPSIDPSEQTYNSSWALRLGHTNDQFELHRHENAARTTKKPKALVNAGELFGWAI